MNTAAALAHFATALAIGLLPGLEHEHDKSHVAAGSVRSPSLGQRRGALAQIVAVTAVAVGLTW